MKIFVAGGAGFIGSHTCVELLNAGYEVAVADNFSNAKPEVIDNIQKITGKAVILRNRRGYPGHVEIWQLWFSPVL